jgi:hypothetical protein
MQINPRTYRRLRQVAAWAFVVAAVSLWAPLSWQTDPHQPGKYVLHLGIGVLEPLRATWQSSADGFWFGFSEVRIVPLLLSEILTLAAILAAREQFRNCRPPPEGSTSPAGTASH